MITALLAIDIGGSTSRAVIVDRDGVVYKGRPSGMDQWKAAHATDTPHRTLAEAMVGADVVLGLSAKGAITKEMVASMAPNPIIFAMANPDPEITPEDVLSVRRDAIIATGRSDYVNQVNNVLGFPYIFRGALDVRASTINEEMKVAAAEALAKLAREDVPDEVDRAYSGRRLRYGPEYIVPVPFDPRLIVEVSAAVAKAAMESGVATRPIPDIAAYKQNLDGSVFRSAMLMRPVFEASRLAARKIVFAEGEDERVLRAANAMLEETTERPILIGRPEVIATRCERAGLPIRPDRDFEIINPESDHRYRDYWGSYHELLQRQGGYP